LKKVRGILKIAQEPISLQTPVGDEGDTHFGDFIEDKRALSPSSATAYTMLKEQMEGVLDTLTDREKQVLRLRLVSETVIRVHSKRLEQYFMLQGRGSGRSRQRRLENCAILYAAGSYETS